MTRQFRYETTSITHQGLVRSANEDAMLVRDMDGLWLVADGMGGHENGRWASGVLVDAAAQTPLTGGFEADIDAVSNGIHQANQVIFRAAQDSGRTTGSTVAVLLIAEGRFACFWAGDSRIYLARDGALHRLTRDHRHVEEMLERGLLSAEEARSHPMSHVLSRVVGVQSDLRLDAITDEVRPRDIFLLCSDGLTGVVSETEMADRLFTTDTPSASHRLLDLVLSRGAPDNVTLVSIACEEKTALVRPRAST